MVRKWQYFQPIISRHRISTHGSLLMRISKLYPYPPTITQPEAIMAMHMTYPEVEVVEGKDTGIYCSVGLRG